MTTNLPKRIAVSARKYRTKLVEIDAIQWDGSIVSADAIYLWSRGAAQCRALPETSFPLHIIVSTNEGVQRANSGDYIVREASGGFFVLKREMFEAKYEPANAREKVSDE